MPESPDYFVEIEGLAQDAGEPENVARPRGRPRPWLSIWWRCCNTYSRIYRRADEQAYAGHCPACGQGVHIPVRADGTDARFFEAC